MKLLLSGANGFIGKNMREGLTDKFEIVCLSHKDVDLTDKKAVSVIIQNVKPEAVIHCAAKPGHRKALDKNNVALINLQIFFAIYESALENGVKKFIHFGSGSEFDMSKPVRLVTENELGKSIPKDETGFSRYVINDALKDSPIGVNLRCFGVFGKYEDYTMRFISNSIVKALAGVDITINENKYFSYLYIEDLISITQAVLSTDKLKHNDYNAVPPYILTMREIVELILEKTGSKSKITILGSGNEYTACGERVANDFKIKFTPFETALDKLIQYYKKNFDCLDLESI